MISRVVQYKTMLRKYRQAVLVIFLTFSLTLLASIGFDVGRIFFSSKEYYYNSPIYIFIIGFLLAFAVFLNKYLGGTFELKEAIKVSSKRDSEQYNEVSKKLKLEVAELRALIKRNQGATLDDNQLNDLISTLKEKIHSEASDNFLDEIRNKTKELIGKETKERLQSHFQRMMKRLSSEIIELGKRSKVNLIIGSVTALSGVSIFMLFVFEKVSPDEVDSYLVTEFAPRISLVIVIEVFAYFFLSLYKNNLLEIKYFHNELTNIESKYMALEEAIATTDTSTVQEIVKELSKTERNFLLKKGESTASLEDKKITVEEQRGVINALLEKLHTSKR